MTKTLLTKEGRVKIQEELNYLSNTEKRRVINELADARDRGGVDENTEYYIAKEEYGYIPYKISKKMDTNEENDDFFRHSRHIFVLT